MTALERRIDDVRLGLGDLRLCLEAAEKAIAEERPIGAYVVLDELRRRARATQFALRYGDPYVAKER